ncbi:hypothetical protein FG91_00820 [Sphingopyxis sp. LC81]|jgi:hypothetical protein|uniref:EexN family lipoprotein n=1 Tax=Sphingopyxis sp. LC81 TaxID=1502850 RepID=UPI00050FD14E|nr:EexN family lipoprotein [Sphingopyxis sp. LC81]KGB55936.1 hypothetical protein FG91_00820 [Sphingopyxis sp. LC81]
MKLRYISVMLLGLGLAACGQSEPRSSQYFEAHIEEARTVVAECKDGSTRGEECTNADIAVQVVEAKERFKRFRSRD